MAALVEPSRAAIRTEAGTTSDHPGGDGGGAASAVPGTTMKAAAVKAAIRDELDTPTRTLNDAPLHLPGAFDPAALLHTEPSSWQSVLQSLSPALPVQARVHHMRPSTHLCIVSSFSSPYFL